METKFRFPFIRYFYFIYLLILPLVKSFSFLNEYDKNKIYYIPSFKNDSMRIIIQNEKNNFIINKVKMECFNSDQFREEYNPTVYKENEFYYFEINLNKFYLCKLNSIVSSNGNINYFNNENPIFNFEEILNLQKHVQYRNNEIISSFQLNDYYIKSSYSNKNIQLKKELNGEYIYNFNSKFESNIILCKKQICFNIKKNIKLRKLNSITSFGPTYYQFTKEKNSFARLAFEFDSNLNGDYDLNFNPINYGQAFNIRVTINNDNTFTKDIPESQMNEGIFNVSFSNASETIGYEKILIFNNTLEIFSKKISYVLKNNNPFNLSIHLSNSIFKQQIDHIEYKKLGSSQPQIVEKWDLNNFETIKFEIPNSWLTDITNYTFFIFDAKDNQTNNSTLTYTLVVSNYIILNPILFMKTEIATQLQGNMTFQAKFFSDQNPTSSDVQLYINGYVGVEIIPNGTDNIYNITFNKNTTSARRYLFRYYNTDQQMEYRYIYLANYTMEEFCQDIEDMEPLYISITYHYDLQSDINVAINIRNYDIKFARATNSSIINTFVTYDYSLSNVFFESGNYSLKVVSEILDLNDKTDIDPENLRLIFVQTLQLLTHNNIRLYMKPGVQNVILNFTTDASGIEEIIINDIDKVSNDCTSDVNDNKILSCSFSNLTDLSESDEGTYKISYKDQCGNWKEIDNLTVDIIYINFLVKIEPPIVLESQKGTKNVTLTYNTSFVNNNLTNFILILNPNNMNVGYNFTFPNISQVGNTIIFNPENVAIGIYYVYTEFTNSTRNFVSDLRFKITNLNVTFTFNHLYFVLNNENNEYDFEHRLIISVSGNGANNVSGIYERNTDIELDKSNNNYSKIMDSPGVFNYDYMDNEIESRSPIDETVYVVKLYSNLFTTNVNECNFYYFNIILTQSSFFNGTLQLDNSYVELNDKKFFVQKNQTNYYYLIDYKDFDDYNYTLKIFENDNDDQYIYIKKPINLTYIIPPEYQYKTNRTISLTNVTCNLTSVDIKFIKNQNVKDLNCTNGNYDPSSKIKSCSIIFNNIYGYHDVQVNGLNITKQTFLSNSLCDSFFDINTDNTTIGIPQSIIINNPNQDFYMPKLEGINYNLTTEQNSVIESVGTLNDNFIVDAQNYTINLTVDYGANYEVIINYLTRHLEDWENNNSPCIRHNFQYDNIFYHYLYKTKYPIIFLEKNSVESSYPIEIEFADPNYANQFYNHFDILNCISPSNKLVNCTLKNNNGAGYYRIRLNNIINSDTFKYISLYYITGNKCQPISATNLNTDIIITIDFHIDLGSVTVFYSNRNKNLLQTFVAQNSNIYTFNYTLPVSDFTEGIAKLYASHQKIYTARFPFDTGIQFYNYYEIDSVEGTLLSRHSQYIKIKFNDDNKIVDNCFHSFTLKNDNESYNSISIIYNLTENYIVIEFNVENATLGEYELYLIDVCGNELNQNQNISIISFHTDRNHYVINNNYNDLIYGTLKGGIKGLYINYYLNGSTTPKGFLSDNENGTYSFNITDPGVYTFSFLNFQDSSVKHDLNISINVVEYFSSFYNSTISTNDMCLLYEIDLNFSLNWSNSYNFSHQIYLEGPNSTCNIDSCYSLINNNNESYQINNKDLGLYPGKKYNILVVENNDVSIPLYSYNFIFGKISLAPPNERFFYLKAPYIKFISNCSISNFSNDPLSFNAIESTSQSFNYTCNNNDSHYDQFTKIYTCVLKPPINYGNDVGGYYSISYNDYSITDKVFISKAIEDGTFIVNYSDLKSGTNRLSIKSEDFFLEELSKFFIGTNYTNTFTADSDIIVTPEIDKDNNSKSIIYIDFNLTKGETKYFFRMERKTIEYDNDPHYPPIQNFIDFEDRYPLKVSLPDVRFFFDKVYIVEESKHLCINKELYNNVTITVSSNFTEDLDSITNITVGYTPLEDEKELCCSQAIKISQEKYYYMIPQDNNIVNFGLYKFYYYSTLASSPPTLIDSYVITTNKIEEIFILPNTTTCINIKDYTPQVSFNENYYFKEYLDKSNIGFLLKDTNNGYIYKYNFNGNNYTFPQDLQKNITITNSFELGVTEKDNRNCLVSSNEIKLINNEFTIDKNLIHYEDNIIFKNVTCLIDPITIENGNDNYTLQCGEISNLTLVCAYDITVFPNGYSNNYNINYGTTAIEKNVSIYNSILNGSFNLDLSSGITYNARNQIRIFSDNFDVSKITEVTITNDEDDNIITCKKNNNTCNITNINTSSLIINPILENGKSYYINTLTRDLVDNEKSGKNSKTINIPIDSLVELKIDKSIIVLQNNANNIGKVTITNVRDGSIDNVFALDTQNNQINLIKNSSNTYILESNKPEFYKFYYTLPDQSINYSTNITAEFVQKGSDLFNISYISNCILKDTNFTTNITWKRINTTTFPQLSVYLNGTLLILSSSNQFYSGQAKLEGEYELLIYQPNNNLLYNSRIEENLVFVFTPLTHSDYYYKDYIYFTNLKCKLDNLSLRYSNNQPISLKCGDISNATIICNISSNPIRTFGNHTILYNSRSTGETTFISNSFSDSKFELTPKESQNPQNINVTIISSSNDFYMPSIKSITLVPSRNEENLLIDNFTIQNNNLSFVFNGSAGNIYTIVLNGHSISNYNNPLSKNLTDKIQIIGTFTLKEIFSAFKFNEQADFSFELQFNIDISQNDTNHTIVMPSGLCQVGTLNNDKTLNISCKLIADSPKIINITYRNDFFDNYYIFIRESDGKYCEGNGYTTNNFKLYKPSDLQKDVTISFTNNTDFDSILSDDIYFCNGTSSLNPTNVIIEMNSYKKEYPLDEITTPINNKLILQESTLVEGGKSQNVLITFDTDLSYNEITSCKIYNNTQFSNSGTFNKEDTRNNNNPKQIIYTFNLENVSNGNYTLECTNLCGTTYNTSIEVNLLTCIPPLVKSNSNSKIECKRCLEINTSTPYYKDGEGKCVTYDDCINDNYGLLNPIETSYMCIKSSYGLIKVNNTYYSPETDNTLLNSVSDEQFCQELCNVDGYKSCDRKWYNCSCNSVFEGLYCQSNSIDREFQTIIENFPSNWSSILITYVVNAKSILYYLEKNRIPENTTLIDEYINKFEQNDISDIGDYNIFYFIEIYNYLISLKQTRLRRLKINETNVHEINKQTYEKTENTILNDENQYKIFSDSLGLVTWIWYINKATEKVKESLKSYEKSSLSIINFTNCFNENYKIILTIIPPNFYSSGKQSDTSGIELKYSIYNENNEPFEGSSEICENVDIYISQRNLDFDIPFYKFYKKGEIDIYDKNNKAFSNPCFQSSKFKWDLTQKYRKTYIYQNITYNYEDKCTYKGIDYLNESEQENINSLIQYQCKINTNINEIKIYNSTDSIENSDKEYNLPFKCHNKVKKIHKNIGFWLYLIIIILYIISSIINTFYYQKFDGNNKGVKNDGIINNRKETMKPRVPNRLRPLNKDPDQREQNIPEERGLENGESVTTDEDKSINQKYNNVTQTENLTLWDSFKKNLFSLHPLFTIGRCSIIRPLMITHFIFLFNISNIFGFNALILNEKRIKRKIWDKGRKNFAYPMRHEFGRIIAVILITMICTVLIRLVSIVSFESSGKTKKKLLDTIEAPNGMEKNDSQINEEVDEYINNVFNKKYQKRNLIAIVIMFLSSVFFWYYTIIWCYVYVNSQSVLFYTLIWSLLWFWFLACIYIVLISIFESILKFSEKTTYYLKILFCF